MSAWWGFVIGISAPLLLWLLMGAPTTFMAQRHEYRGFSYAADLLDRIFVVGWATVWFSRRPLLDRLRNMLRAAPSPHVAADTD